MTDNESEGTTPRAQRSGTPDSPPARPQRPLLQRSTVIFGLAAIVLSIVATSITLYFQLSPDSAPEKTPAGVSLVDVDLDRQKNVRADWENLGTGNKGSDTASASQLTVIIRNETEDPALITKASFRFSAVDSVGCPSGGGGVQTSARYDIKVTGDSKPPFSADRR